MQNEHFEISQISVSMALMPYSFDLGYIINISFREEVQRLTLAGYCPWIILLRYNMSINVKVFDIKDMNQHALC